MSLICRLRGKSHGADGIKAADEIERLRKLLAEMEWINCNDRLPELKDDNVLVYFSETGSIETVHIEDYFKDITAGHDTFGRPAHTKWYTWKGVTHWMPLPEAPNVQIEGQPAVGLSRSNAGLGSAKGEK